MYEEYTHTTDEQIQAKADAHGEAKRDEYAARTTRTGEPIPIARVDRMVARRSTRWLRKSRRYQNKALYAYVEIPASLFDTIIPLGISLPWVRVQETATETRYRDLVDPLDEDKVVQIPYEVEVLVFRPNGEPKMRRRTIGEYFLFRTLSLDGTKAIILVAGAEAPTYRMKGIRAAEVAKCHDLLNPFGHGNTTWMDQAAASAMMQTGDYSGEA